MGKSIKNLPSCAIIGLDVAKNPHPEFEITTQPPAAPQ